MTGPCMCGDPYCPSCGDPSLAQFEEFFDNLYGELSKLDDIECRLFVAAGRAAVECFKEAQLRANSDGDWHENFEIIKEAF